MAQPLPNLADIRFELEQAITAFTNFRTRLKAASTTLKAAASAQAQAAEGVALADRFHHPQPELGATLTLATRLNLQIGLAAAITAQVASFLLVIADGLPLCAIDLEPIARADARALPCGHVFSMRSASAAGWRSMILAR